MGEDSSPLVPSRSDFHSLINLPTNSERVTDADEEVFLLYTCLAAQTSKGYKPSGLGSVDSKKDHLIVSLEIEPKKTHGAAETTLFARSPRKGKHHASHQHEESKVIEVPLSQDTTGLRSRKGDTGSVLWRASVELARHILRDHHFPPKSTSPLFDPATLRKSHILELGSGTGLLGILLSPMVSHYTMTDISVLLPLLRKNISLNTPPSPGDYNHHRSKHSSPSSKLHPPDFAIGNNQSIDELDWVELASSLPSFPSRRTRYSPSHSAPIDLILCVDCIFNPSLLPPLVTTIDRLSQLDTTVPTLALVVCELRDEDVVRAFLEEWLKLDGWEIWSLGGDDAGDGDGSNDTEKDEVDRGQFLPGPFAAWLGIKR